MKTRTILITGVVAAAALALAGLGTYFALPGFQQPDSAQMRAFRLSVLTDENLRDLHAKAVVEVQRRREENLTVLREATADMNAKIAECESKAGDVAYKARHPEPCGRRPFLTPEERFAAVRSQTVEEVLEDMILGVCQYVHSIREARNIGCLPR